MHRHDLPSRRSAWKEKSAPHKLAVAAAAATALLGFAAVANTLRAREAERSNPPTGRFVTVDGVRLHYVTRGDTGDGRPVLVMLHGNGSMVQDFLTSGLIDLAARRYRVIAFDRTGFGHSDRPRSRVWSAGAQADLIHKAMARIGVSQAIVLGHSWGSVVAMALALRHPHAVKGLVVASGYYYPTPRADSVLLAGPAIPVLGDVVRYTLSPVLGRLFWPRIMRRMFGPAPVPHKFAGFPKEMALRPSQIRASAAEAGLLVATAQATRSRYHELRMPVTIIAGAADRLIDTEAQSARLHEDIPHSHLHRIPGAGHMVHQTAPHAVMRAIDELAEDIDNEETRRGAGASAGKDQASV
jgi:pimeloyl-ACP methyl ester carboxylesterase